MSEGILYHQRILALGNTRSGKSELLNHLFTTIRCQKVLLDTKGGEWAVPGVEPVRSAEAIDWTQPVIHFITQSDDPMEIDPLFKIARYRRHLSICVHEMTDLCNYSAQRTPPNVSAYLSKGGANGLGLLGASQRPVEMPVRGKTEVQHVFVVVPRMTANDVKAIAELGIGIEAPQLGVQLDNTEAEHGEHSFIWFAKGVRGFKICPPLPEEIRKQTIVRRQTVV